MKNVITTEIIHEAEYKMSGAFILQTFWMRLLVVFFCHLVLKYQSIKHSQGKSCMSADLICSGHLWIAYQYIN